MGMQKKLRQIEKKAEKKKQQDYEKNRDLFIKRMKKASLETNIDAVPVIQARPEGIYPLIAFIDVKERNEKEAAAKKEKESSKPKLEV